MLLVCAAQPPVCLIASPMMRRAGPPRWASAFYNGPEGRVSSFSLRGRLGMPCTYAPRHRSGTSGCGGAPVPRHVIGCLSLREGSWGLGLRGPQRRRLVHASVPEHGRRHTLILAETEQRILRGEAGAHTVERVADRPPARSPPQADSAPTAAVRSTSAGAIGSCATSTRWAASI